MGKILEEEMSIGKPSIKNLGKPRPKVLKAIGDTCIYAGGAVAGIGTANGSQLVTYISLAFMVLGNLFTNLYAASDTTEQVEDTNNSNQQNN